MELKEGEEVRLHLSKNEVVEGEIIATDVEDIFGVGWTVSAVITELGHARHGQVGIFSPNEISKKEATTW